jgi:UDP-2-acetamido-3-amino-2,3-dideoxy-glucuronate N-acetyltransferase
MISKFAEIAESAIIASGVVVWHFTQIRERVTIGNNTIIGRNVYIGPDVVIGANCKIQNNALIYEPTVIADGVFVGPGVIFTNDRFPRAVNADMSLKSSSDWDIVGVKVDEGASIGAGSVCIGPIQIGKWSVIGAGSVVTKNVLPYTLVSGNPARHMRDLI